MSHCSKESLSYVHGASDVPLIGSTIGDFFDLIAARFQASEALVCCHQRERYSYRELQFAVNSCARGLMACGLQKGDRVGIWAQNRTEWVITQIATAKIGAILVNVNPAYRVQELAYALRQSGCSGLIISPSFRTSDYPAMLREVCPELNAGEPGQLSAEALPHLRTVITLGTEQVAGAYRWDQMMAKADEVTLAELAERQSAQSLDDPINIQYTSGTTGSPKGATLSHHSLLNNGFFIGERMHLTDQDRYCIPVPFYHCAGMVVGNLACITHGAAMVIPAEVFDPRKTLEAVVAERCTALLGVPTMFIAELGLADLDQFDLSTLRTGCIGGSPCPIEVMKQLTTRMHMGELTIVYGMTETSPVSFQSAVDDPLEKRVSTVGRVHPHVECKIIDRTTGKTLLRGVPGELLSRGYLVMLGYWGNPEATAQAIDAARWMHTGDLAVMRPDGYVNIVGRCKDLIIRGGENIYPREIEDFLYTHAAIRDVQIIGVPDEKYGEEVMAWVILKPGQQLGAKELREYCRNRIAHYKVPRYIRFTDQFPMTVSGKIQKYKMREMAVQELGLSRAACIRTA